MFRPQRVVGSVTNAERAKRGEVMIKAGHGKYWERDAPESLAGDAIADIFHYLDREGADIEEALENARSHWEEER